MVDSLFYLDFRPHQFPSEIVTIFCEFVRNVHRDYSVLLPSVLHVIIPEIATKLRG